MPKQRLIYLILLLLTALFYLLYWDYIAFAALLLVAILPVLSWLLTLLIGLGVHIRLEAPSTVTTRGGTPGALRIVAVNRGFLPVAVARVVITMKNQYSPLLEREELLFPIGGFNTTRVELNVHSSHCGLIIVSLKKVRFYDFFRLFPAGKRTELQAELTVLPEGFELQNHSELSASESIDSALYSTRKRGDDASQVFDYHEYREGDKLKEINWKLSARLDRLMVKEGSLPLSSTVRIAVELAGLPPRLSQFDLTLESCCSLSGWLSGREVVHELAWFSGTEGTVERLRIEKPDDLFDALFRLYRLRPYQKPWLLEQMASQAGREDYSTLVYITSVMSLETAGLLKKLRDCVPVKVIYAAEEEAAEPDFLRGVLGEEIPLTILRESNMEEEMARFELD